MRLAKCNEHFLASMGLLYIRGRVLVYEGAVQQRRQAATVLAGCALCVCVILPVPLSVDHDSELC